MSDEELDEMIDLADPNHEGLVNYLGMSSNIICSKKRDINSWNFQ